jgi:ribosomal protein S12 methylthiotransferase
LDFHEYISAAGYYSREGHHYSRATFFSTQSSRYVNLSAMKARKSNPITVGFVALGCPKNMVDSERMLAEIAQSDFVISAEPAQSDVVIVNTCGFIAPAKAEAMSVINEAIEWKQTSRVKKVIVAGCLSQRMGKELFAEANGIDAIVGLGRRDDIAQIINETIASDKQLTFLGGEDKSPNDDRVRLRIGPSHWAYLRISEGCDHPCSFCTIPAIRGRFRSKTPEQVLAEAKELADAGVLELNVIGQDTSYYGRDLKMKDGLACLLNKLAGIDQLQWIRLMYLYPTEITEKLIETVAGNEKIVHYLDIPLQHINDSILQSMRRQDKSEKIRRLIEKLREAIRDIVLRTTFIVGFPGETDEQFEQLLEFAKWAGFDALGCFKYYPEQGTDAARMPNQVPEHIKEQRVEQLMLAQQQIAFEKNQSRIGSTINCLVDSVDTKKRQGNGRFYGQAPEIDSICIINNCLAKPGRFINTKVTHHLEYDLVVEQI